MSEGNYWDASIQASKAAMSRLMLAFVKHRAHFTSSMRLGSDEWLETNGRGITVWLRVWVPTGVEDAFAKDAQVTLKTPPKAHLNWCNQGRP